MIAAVIDVGTNSIKMVVGERTSSGAIEELAQLTANTRLGECVDVTGSISDEAAERSISAIEDYIRLAHELGAARVRVAGTSALRDAGNRDSVIERVRRVLGVDLEVLPEEDECRYSYLAIAMDPELGQFQGTQVVADVGGGSSELTFGTGTHVISGKSTRIGAVRLTERYLTADPPTPQDVKDAIMEAETLLADAVVTCEVSRVVGVGGSAVNLARMVKGIASHTIAGIHATAITRPEMQRLIDMLAHSSLEERYQIIGLEPERADIILGGAIVLQAVMTITTAPELVISTRGLRHGLLYHMLGEAK